MLGNCSSRDDGPRTLQSTLFSREDSVRRSSDNSATLSLMSRSLQISQSVTGVFITNQCKGSTATAEITSTTPTIQNECSHLVSLDNSSQDVSSSTASQRIDNCSDPLRDESNKNVLDNESSPKLISVLHSKVTNMPTECPAISDSLRFPHEHSTGLPNSDIIRKPFSDQSTNLSYSDLPGYSIWSDLEGTPSHSNLSAPSQQFFSFVILHVSEDQIIASRVCQVLQDLGVGNGSTFCEGFETPGMSPLTCLEHAVENSAYVVLLLTDAFLSNWGMFQAKTVLMNSIENGNKFGSVIPFYPYLKKPVGQIPLCIRTLLPLDENLPLFKSKVHHTFKKNVIKNQYELWKKQNLTYMKNPQQPHNISQEYSSNVCSPEYLQNASMFPSPLFNGQTPIIQINNAANVQIGNQNSMHVQMSPNEPNGELNDGYPDESSCTN